MSEALFKQIAAQTQARHDVILADLDTAVSQLGQRVDNNIARYTQIITLTIQALERNQLISKDEKAQLYKRLVEKAQRRQQNIETMAKINAGIIQATMTPRPSTQAPRTRINPIVEAVTRNSVTEPKVVTREKPKQQPAPTKPQPWPFPTPSKQPTKPAKPTTPMPKVYVQVRKHPTGQHQPLGERRVFKMEAVPNSTMIRVGIGPDGSRGWIFDLTQPGPTFLTFRAGPYKNALTMRDAWEYWQASLMKK